MSISEFRGQIKLNSRFPYKIEFSNAPKRMLPHWHEEIELMYFYNTEGCQYLCHGELIDVKAGDLIVANSCEVHECFDFGNKASVCCLITSLEALGCQSVGFANKYNSEEISRYFEQLLKKRDTEKFSLEVMSAIYGILADLCTCNDSVSDNASSKYPNIKRIKTALEYIGNNLSSQIKISDLAQITNLSEDGFYHIFKSTTGMSPSLYILEQRIISAQKLLKNTDYSMSEISLQCGFCSSSYFAEKFKAVCGVSPNKYRKDMQILDESL